MTPTLGGSRTGSGIAAAWATLLYVGEEKSRAEIEVFVKISVRIALILSGRASVRENTMPLRPSSASVVTVRTACRGREVCRVRGDLGGWPQEARRRHRAHERHSRARARRRAYRRDREHGPEGSLWTRVAKGRGTRVAIQANLHGTHVSASQSR